MILDRRVRSPLGKEWRAVRTEEPHPYAIIMSHERGMMVHVAFAAEWVPMESGLTSLRNWLTKSILLYEAFDSGMDIVYWLEAAVRSHGCPALALDLFREAAKCPAQTT